MSSTTLSTSSQDASPSGIVTRSRKRLLDEDITSSSEADPRDRKRSKVEPRPVRRSLRHAAKPRSPSPPHVERSEPTPSTSRSVSLSDDGSDDASFSGSCHHEKMHATEQEGVTSPTDAASPTPAPIFQNVAEVVDLTHHTDKKRKRSFDRDDEDDDEDQKLTDETTVTWRPHSSKRVKVEGDAPAAGTSSTRRQCASRPASTRRWRSPTLSPPPPSSAEATEALRIATFDVSERVANKIHDVPLESQVLEEVDGSTFALETSSEEIPVEKPDTHEPSSGSCLQGEGSNEAPFCETSISLECQDDGYSSLSDWVDMSVNDAVTSAPSSIGPSENRDEASSGPRGTGGRTPVLPFPSVKGVATDVPPGIRRIPFPLGVEFEPESPKALLEAARAAFHANTGHSPQVHYAFYRKSLLFRCRPSSPLSPNPGKRITKLELEWIAGDRLTSALDRHEKSDRMLPRRNALQRAIFLRTGVKISEWKSNPRRMYLANGANFSGRDKPVCPETGHGGYTKTDERTGFETLAQVSITQDRTGGADSNVHSLSGSVSYDSLVSELPAATVEYSDEATFHHPDLYPSDSSCTTPHMDLDPDLDPDLGRTFHSQGMTAGFLDGDSLGAGSSFSVERSELLSGLGPEHQFASNERVDYASSAEPESEVYFGAQQSVGYRAPAEPHTGAFVPKESVHVSAAEPQIGALVAQGSINDMFLPEPQASAFSQQSVHVSAAEPQIGPFVVQESAFSSEPQASALVSQQSIGHMYPPEPDAGAFASQEFVHVSATEPQTGPFVAQESATYTFPQPQASAFVAEESVNYLLPPEPDTGAFASQESVHVSATESQTGPFVAQESATYTFPQPQASAFVAEESLLPPEPDAGAFASQPSVGDTSPAQPQAGDFVTQLLVAFMSQAQSQAGSLVSQSSAGHMFEAPPGQHLEHQGLSYYIEEATLQGPSVEPSSGHDADTTSAIDPALLVTTATQPSWDPTELEHSPLIPLSGTQSQLLLPQNMFIESSLSGVVSYLEGNMQRTLYIVPELHEDLDAPLDTSSASP